MISYLVLKTMVSKLSAILAIYPSISEELVTKSLKFAGNYTVVSTEDLSLIKNACKSVLYKQGNLW